MNANLLLVAYTIAFIINYKTLVGAVGLSIFYTLIGLNHMLLGLLFLSLLLPLICLLCLHGLLFQHLHV